MVEDFTMQSNTLRTNGQELFYEAHGEGPPLVLVMGIGYESSLWKLAQVPALAKKFRVIIFDNRDVGRSSKARGPYSIADMADDLVGLLDTLDIPRAHILGLSMGGMIAQQVAIRHPTRVDRLVLAGCGAAPARTGFDPIRAWAWLKRNDPSGETFACEQFTWLFSTAFRRNRQAVDSTIAMLSSNPNPVTADAYQRQADAYLAYDALDQLGGIRAPTQMIVGEQDLLTPPWVCEEVTRMIRGARFEVIEGDGASHLVAIERPDDFNSLVVRFLEA
jgi:pimeloyl-ACP methyl ester carboxylesterase